LDNGIAHANKAIKVNKTANAGAIRNAEEVEPVVVVAATTDPVVAADAVVDVAAVVPAVVVPAAVVPAVVMDAVVMEVVVPAAVVPAAVVPAAVVPAAVVPAAVVPAAVVEPAAQQPADPGFTQPLAPQVYVATAVLKPLDVPRPAA